MKNILRLTIAAIVAIVTALSISFAAFAVSGYHPISEQAGLWHWLGVLVPPSGLTNSACLNANNQIGTGGACSYRYGSTTSVSWYRWGLTTPHTYQIYAYDPNIGQSVAKYTWWEASGTWPVTVDQSNTMNKKTWVYLGYSDFVSTNTGGYLILNNDCSGWTCGNMVLWDSMRYNTNP